METPTQSAARLTLSYETPIQPTTSSLSSQPPYTRRYVPYLRSTRSRRQNPNPTPYLPRNVSPSQSHLENSLSSGDFSTEERLTPNLPRNVSPSQSNSDRADSNFTPSPERIISSQPLAHFIGCLDQDTGSDELRFVSPNSRQHSPRYFSAGESSRRRSDPNINGSRRSSQGSDSDGSLLLFSSEASETSDSSLLLFSSEASETSDNLTPNLPRKISHNGWDADGENLMRTSSPVAHIDGTHRSRYPRSNHI